jgi:hypothetical protein
MVESSDDPRKEIEQYLQTGSGSAVAKFALSVLAGAIPWGGGVISATSEAWDERNEKRYKRIMAAWLRLQEDEIREIAITMHEVVQRLDLQDEMIVKRLESREYLSIVKKAFRDWSAAESEVKRVKIRNLLANAAATEVCSDDVVRQFLQWIDIYSESHFQVIAAIYNHAGITRREIGFKMYGGQIPREDSAEADLFRLQFRDLSTGGIIRQHRETDYHGNFIKRQPQRGRGSSSTLKSTFDGEDKYELTQLGQQFVHYTMNELTTRIEYSPSQDSETA